MNNPISPQTHLRTLSSLWLKLFLLLLFTTTPAQANSAAKPRWELGAGLGFLNFPDYPGSNQQRSRILPIPYVRYRGRRLNVDHDGIYSDLFSSDRVTLRFSLAAGLPAKSKQNGARADMPDLDPTLEIGPSIQVTLAKSGDHQVALRFPVRAVVATDLRRAESLGWVFAPDIMWTWNRNKWNTRINIGPVYASEDYHDYYYEVDPVFATSDRPVYNARGGLNGFRSALTATRRIGSWWLGMFVSYHDLSHARIHDSPLVKQDSSLMIGMGLAWVFAKSD